jgi:hypothetical protein
MQQLVNVDAVGDCYVGPAARPDLRSRSEWSGDVQCRLLEAGVRAALTPEPAPNAKAYAERFVRSITEECLHRLVPLGERTR